MIHTLSTPQLFDVHTHTHFAAFKDDRDVVIKRALDADIWMVNVGTQQDTSVGAIKTAHMYEKGVYATVGLHPIHTEASYHDVKELGGGDTAKGFTSKGEAFDYDFYLNLAKDSKIVGIGECGLDYYRLEETTKHVQQGTFEQQIALAKEVAKPLMIHCRKAFPDLIAILNANRVMLNVSSGIIHFFSGTIDDAKKLLDLNFSFSFGGVVTFARDYDGVVQYIPLEHIVLETDAPYITPVPYRGKRNEPFYVQEAAKKIAELRHISYEEICAQTTANAVRLFNLTP